MEAVIQFFSMLTEHAASHLLLTVNMVIVVMMVSVLLLRRMMYRGLLSYLLYAVIFLSLLFLFAVLSYQDAKNDMEYCAETWTFMYK